ncbi:MAG: AAA family ATPase [Candidatus Babeliales bacterium]
MIIKAVFFVSLTSISLPAACDAKRFVITGGPGVGKTTLINELKQQGYQTVPEIYGELYAHAVAHNMLASFFADPCALYTQLLEEQIKYESLLDMHMPAFLDRSAIDILAFAQYFNVPLSEQFCERALREYDTIFLLDPLPRHLYEQCARRKETQEEAACLHAMIKLMYISKGYQEQQLIDVPFGTPLQRIEFIFAALKSINGIVP